MRYFSLLAIAIFYLIDTLALAQNSADELLAQSIKFHNPNGTWKESKLTLLLKETRPGADDRHSRITIDNKKNGFLLDQIRDGQQIKMQITKRKTKIWFNEKTPKDSVIINKYRLSQARALTMKNYYTYLYNLPMQLENDGSIIDPKIINVEFNNMKVLAIKINYPPEIGSDTWYFYFAPDTKQLVGYRFYHDENDNDGEYIILEGTSQIGSLILPTKRSWYTNDKSKFLGSDIIIKSFE